MKFRIIFILSIISSGLFSQNFSGEIEYHTSYVPKNNNINIDSLIENGNGTVSKYTITDKYYKSSYLKNGEVTYSYIYDDVSKRMYDINTKKKYITYRDSRKANYDYKSSKVYKDSTEIILGRECFMVDYDSDYGKTKTYYSDDIKVNYNAFEGHKVGNWYEKLKEVNGCISIKTVTEFKDYFQISEAVKITPREVAFNEFDIPSGKIIVASPLALDEGVKLVETPQSEIDCYFNKIDDAIKVSNTKDDVISYVSFILDKKGNIKYIESLQEDDYGYHEVAVDIVKNCQFNFSIGKIDGTPVSSLVYFPVEFKKK